MLAQRPLSKWTRRPRKSAAVTGLALLALVVGAIEPLLILLSVFLPR